MTTAHLDTFIRDRLPTGTAAPNLIFELPELDFPTHLNCGAWLLAHHRHVGASPDKPCLIGTQETWTYRQLLERSSQIAHVLVEDLGVVPGNRVLLLGYNRPLLVAAWYAIMLTGAIAVTLVPSSPVEELRASIDRVQPTAALVEQGVTERLAEAAGDRLGGASLEWIDDTTGPLPSLMATKSTTFTPVETAAEDPCIITFTSGSEGLPKAAVHTHRDVVAVSAVFAGANLAPQAEDIFASSAPMAFTFGLIALACFPVYVGGSVVIEPWRGPERLAEAIATHRVTICFTVPTVYRMWLRQDALPQLASVRVAVSSGEPLSAADWHAYHDGLGLDIVNCLGSTEMLHAFMSTARQSARPGSIGMPIRGYRAMIMDPDGAALEPGKVGMLAVQGPTGCRYLDDPRQATQVRNGWTLTGDLARQDADGYFWFEGRADRTFVSAGHVISPAEVELALNDHPDVIECAVIATPDEVRTTRIKAVVVVRDSFPTTPEGEALLRDFLSTRLSRYKHPHVFAFVGGLPRTATGKIAVHRLR